MHSGVRATFKRIERYFYWPGLVGDVTKFVSECTTCQQCKGGHVHPPGLLQPLHIPNTPWEDISMDFIEGILKSTGKDSIMVVVSRLTKYSHFIALTHPFSTMIMAQVFFENIFKYHGIPKTVVRDRDPIFLNQFWVQLFNHLGTQLLHTFVYHRQTDGQTERVNQCV